MEAHSLQEKQKETPFSLHGVGVGVGGCLPDRGLAVTHCPPVRCATHSVENACQLGASFPKKKKKKVRLGCFKRYERSVTQGSCDNHVAL